LGSPLLSYPNRWLELAAVLLRTRGEVPYPAPLAVHVSYKYARIVSILTSAQLTYIPSHICGQTGKRRFLLCH